MSEHAAILPRYKQLRELSVELNTRLSQLLSKDAIEEGGNKLGILKGKTILLDSEDMICVLMDYCLYNVRRQGMNTIERYLAESPPPPDSDEMVILKGMQNARYTLFLVESSERGVGITIRDLLCDETRFVTDVSFSQSAQIGLVLAGRLLAPEGICITSGAVLPVGVLPSEERDRFLQPFLEKFKGAGFRHITPEEESELAAALIRMCLKRGAAEHIEYREPGSSWTSGAPRPVTPRTPHIGRNDRCPCGSGKKFKHCCGAHGEDTSHAYP